MKRFINRILVFILISAAFVPAAFAVEETEINEEVIVLKNNKESHNLKVHDTEIIQFTINLDSEYTVNVIEVPEAILDVSLGENQMTVTALKVGKATLTMMVRVDEQTTYTKELWFNVTQEKGTISFNESSKQLIRGKSFTVDFEVEPKTLDLSRIVWESSDANVARVENGIVQGLRIGETTIMASLDGQTQSMEVRVVAPLEKLEFNPSTLKVTLNDVKNIPDLIYVPYDTTVKRNPQYAIEDESIAVIEGDTIRGLKVGETELIASIGNINTSLKIIVSEQSIAGNAHTLLLETLESSDDGMFLGVRDFQGLEKDVFELYLPTNEVLSYMENREYTRLYIALEEELLAKRLNNMERFNIDKDILLQLGAQKLEVYFTDMSGKIQFAAYFDNRFKQDFNLAFNFNKIDTDHPLYTRVKNNHSFHLIFKEEVIDSFRFAVLDTYLETHSEQIYFHYENFEKEIHEVQSQLKTQEQDLLILNIQNQDNVISLTPISVSNYYWIIITLTAIILVLGGFVFYKNKSRLGIKKS